MGIPRPGRAGRRARTEPGRGDRPAAPRRGAAPARGPARPMGRGLRLPGDALPGDGRLASHGLRLLRTLLFRAARDGRAGGRAARRPGAEALRAAVTGAEQIPCIQLRRELQGHEETQMCARGEFDVWVPRRVGGLLALAFAAARKAAGRWLSPGECLVRIAEHFIEVWKTDAGGAEHGPEGGPRAGSGT